MHLCEKCKTLDFRALFQLYLDKDGPAPTPFPHSIFGIRQGSLAGCEFCSLAWSDFMTARIEERKYWAYMGPQGEITDGELASRYKALFWSADSGGHVRIWSPEREGDMISNTVALFVAFPLAENPLVDDTALKALLSQEILPDSGSDGALEIAAKWLQQCRNEHEHCSWTKLLPKSLPTRVIDVGSGAESPRLHITTDGELGTWTALSYCWGGASKVILTAETRPRFEQGMPLDSFPVTLRDAITVTRALDIRYIWIDALCILQDSAEDWEREAPKMGHIYTNSEVVIAASDSDNVNAGIFKLRPRPKNLEMLWTPAHPADKSPEQFVRIHAMAADSLAKIESEDPHWSTRGWTMQEDFMATRLLMFTNKQTHWECLTNKIDESGFSSTPGYVFAESRDYCSRYVTRMISTQVNGMPFSITSTDPGYPDYDPDLYKMWYMMVKTYSQRNLTKISDRLPALGGLAICFHDILKDNYYAGLWKNDIISGLTWAHGVWGYAAEEVSREAGGPSWSWTSLEGKLDDFVIRSGPKDDDEVPQTATRLIDIQVDLVSESYFGAVKSGRLIIEAPFVNWKPEDTLEDSSNLQKFIVDRVSDPKYAVNAEFKLRHKSYISQTFIALHLFTGQDKKAQILLLESVEPSAQLKALESRGNNEQPVYVRVGKLQIRSRWIFNKYDDPTEMSYISEIEHGAYLECVTTTLPSRYSDFAVPQAQSRGALPVQRFIIV